MAHFWKTAPARERSRSIPEGCRAAACPEPVEGSAGAGVRRGLALELCLIYFSQSCLFFLKEFQLKLVQKDFP
jgi:hypothetical protein